MKSRTANPAHTLDGGTPSWLQTGSNWRGVVYPMGYMNNAPCIISLWLFVLLLACVEPLRGSAQQKAAPAAPPTGTYAPIQPTLFMFTLRLETNGTYLAKYTRERVPTQDGDLVRLLPRTSTAQGTWRWDAEKREFRLEPGDFDFYIKRLPADPQHTNRLVWGSSWLVREDTK